VVWELQGRKEWLPAAEEGIYRAYWNEFWFQGTYQVAEGAGRFFFTGERGLARAD